MTGSLLPPYFIQVLYYSILVEIFLTAILLISLVVIRVRNRFLEEKNYLIGRKISGKILEYMKGKGSLDDILTLNGKASRKLLLKEVELFNQRFSGVEWRTIKEEIVKKYLIDFARNLSKKKDWHSRAMASRICALSPTAEEKDMILQLLDDSVFLVRGQVAPAAIELRLKEGVLKILHQMSKEPGYPRYYYRDVLLNHESQEVFDWIEEIAETPDGRDLQLACLDVLSGKMQTIQGNFLLRDVQSEDDEIRLAAIKVYARNPQKKSLEILLSHVQDSNEKVRIEVFYGLEHFRQPKTLEILEKGLEDDSWEVRVQAANSLKNMGRLGIDVLKRQSLEKHRNAYEAANYILQLDW